MIIKKINNIVPFIASDETKIREVLHPKNGDTSNLSYSLAHASLPVGQASLPHRLLESSEVYVFTKGNGQVSIEGKHEKVEQGTVVQVLKGQLQSVENTGDCDLEFWCIVSPPWSAESDVND